MVHPPHSFVECDIRSLLTIASLLCASACSGASSDSSITVLAASSLTDAFDALAVGFETAHPGADVTLSYAGSQTLTMQVEQGLQADVIATADAQHITRLIDANLAQGPAPFASNRLVLATSSNGTGPHSLDSLPDAERLVLALPEVPLGAYTEALLADATTQRGEAWRAGVRASVVSREPNARLVAAKVAMGEADAAIVYATDVRAHPELIAHDLGDARATQATYVQARLSEHPLSEAWTTWVLSDAGQRILVEHDFGGAP